MPGRSAGTARDERIVTVFRSRIREDVGDEYGRLASRLTQLASSMDGFVEIKGFTSEDGEQLSLVTFDSFESHERWRKHSEHREAQQLGRADFYEQYQILVMRVVAERDFERRSSV